MNSYIHLICRLFFVHYLLKLKLSFFLFHILNTKGYCQRPGECRCRIGYTGELCDKCIPLPGCQHGDCTKPFECLCRPGWDGLFCTERMYCPYWGGIGDGYGYGHDGDDVDDGNILTTHI